MWTCHCPDISANLCSFHGRGGEVGRVSLGAKGDDFDMFKAGDDNSDGLIRRSPLAYVPGY